MNKWVQVLFSECSKDEHELCCGDYSYIRAYTHEPVTVCCSCLCHEKEMEVKKQFKKEV